MAIDKKWKKREKPIELQWTIGLIGTWFNSISDLAARIPQSQIFTGFYNVNFSWFNNTWFNSQTLFTGNIF